MFSAIVDVYKVPLNLILLNSASPLSKIWNPETLVRKFKEKNKNDSKQGEED